MGVILLVLFVTDYCGLAWTAFMTTVMFLSIAVFCVAIVIWSTVKLGEYIND
jgi:hypothetical protein